MTAHSASKPSYSQLNMRLRLTNLRLPVETTEAELPSVIARQLHVNKDEILNWRILRKSLDARAKRALKFEYSVSVEVPDDPKLEHRLIGHKHVDLFQDKEFENPTSGKQPLEHRPIIIGTGPAGLLAGYYLAQRGYRPLLIDRGYPVKERVPAIRAFDRHQGDHDPENNYLFGEGGAGCFSDGKLTCRMSGPDVDWVLNAFIECGGRESIAYEHRPHLGSNKLPMICRNFRRKIEELGGEYQFACCLEGLKFENNQLTGIQTSSGFLAAELCILGIGHSARDTYQMLYESGVPIVQKAFQLGLRIEHPQDNVNQWKYGHERYLDILGAADYSLVAKAGKGNQSLGRDVYSFCMCAGGYVIPSVSEPGHFCTNGMSLSRHDSPFANSGLMVTLSPEEFGSSHPLAGMELQRRYEAVAYKLGRDDYLSPIQSAKSFLNGTQANGPLPSSYERGTVNSDLNEVLPPIVAQAMRAGLPVLDDKWNGQYLKQATLVGPEMRGSAPLRIERDRASYQCPGLQGLFPVGEGAGYAGGIISAAVDGLRSAKCIVRDYARP